jgi:hypothetical protein
MKKLPSYSEVYALGHRILQHLFEGKVLVEEKVDGSQFSFGIINDELTARSKSKEQSLEAGVDDMFKPAWEVIKSLDLHKGWIYRGEYLAKPKHNTLCYSRIPNNHIIIYDIDVCDQFYLSPKEKKEEAERLGLECVPCIDICENPTLDNFNNWLEKESCLGGTKIEGVVIKNYTQYGQDKKVLMGKYVSEAFKEKHQREWKVGNPSNNDVIELLSQELKTEARWEKAVQHLRDSGQLLEEPKDIGLLMQEVPNDILKEEEEYIKDRLIKWAWPHIKRKVTGGLPEWYKNKLAEKQFIKE